MENLTPNTRTTPDRDTDQTLQPIQAIFAFRFAVKKIGQQHHGPIRKAVGRGLLTGLSQSNRTNPNPTGSRVSRNSARRASESILRLRSAAPEQNKPKRARQRYKSSRKASKTNRHLHLRSLEQNKPKFRHQSQTAQPKPKAKPKLAVFFSFAQPEQNKPKPPSRLQKHLGKRTKRSRHQTLKLALTARVSGQPRRASSLTSLNPLE